jgi:hypothetical protein
VLVVMGARGVLVLVVIEQWVLVLVVTGARCSRVGGDGS